jgi:prepilin-type N-terminal cleavage/methylation domain-containing protein/prepilin-type processing-associated H-X9-DG protein
MLQAGGQSIDRTCTGFTLIELLVVLAIVLVLASLAVPGLLHSVDLSRRVTCMSNQRQIGMGVFLYAQDHDDDKPPLQAEPVPMKPSFTSPNVKIGTYVGLGHLIEDYLSTHEILLCQGIEPKSDNNSDREAWLSAFVTGSSYLYEWFHPATTTYRIQTEQERQAFEATSHLVAAPAGQAMVMDLNCKKWTQYNGPVYAHRSLGTCNILFHDGHVNYFPYEEGLVAERDKRYNLWRIWGVAHRLGAPAGP